MIAIIDYGVGNLFSLKSSLKKIGAESCVSADPEVLRQADKLILPGVGGLMVLIIGILVGVKIHKKRKAKKQQPAGVA